MLLLMSRKLLVLLSILFSNHLHAQKKGDWISLFNGKDLSGWNTYLEVALDSSGTPLGTTPLGYNNDPQKIFSVVRREKMIRISGQTWGAVSTKGEFENYHLQLRFKWGKARWAEKKDAPMDSGLLYHSIGEPMYSGWLTAHEFQIEENHSGDYWSIGNVLQTIPNSFYRKQGWGYDPEGELREFGREGERRCPRATTATEYSAGEWNTLDLFCYGDTSVHLLNGKVVMVLYQSKQYINGKEIPLTKGKIQLQSEGAEVFYKDIRIRTITGLKDVLSTIKIAKPSI